MLDVAAFGPLCLGDGLADEPEVSRLIGRLRDRGVQNEPFLARGDENVLHLRLRAAIRLRPRDLEQHVPGIGRRKGIARALDVLEHDLDHEARDELEGRQRRARARLRLGKQRQRILDRGQRDHGRRHLGRARQQAQHRRRDDAERALRADEEIAQVVARVVLLERAQTIPHAPVRQHDFETQHLLARIAIGEHADAARVRAEIAANAAAPLRGQRQRKEAACLLGDVLAFLQRQARLDGHARAHRIDMADLVHARDRDDDLAMLRDLAAHKTCVARLWNHGEVQLVGERHDAAHLFRRAGAQHEGRAADVLVAQFFEVGELLVGIDEGVRFPDDRGKALDDFRGERAGAVRGHLVH